MKNLKTNDMKRLILMVLFLGSFSVSRAQQDPMISHYMFNGLFLNPAYAGSHKYASANVLHRSQWLGYGDGAPRTNLLALDAPIKSQKMGLGFVFVNDRVGKQRRNDLVLNYSYHIRVSQKGKLAFGISAGAINLGLDNPFAWESNDPALQTRSFWGPRAGFGVYYYTRKSYLGFSVPTLVGKQPDRAFDFNLDRGTLFRRHYLLTGGYVFDVGSNIMLKPSFLLKYQPAAPFQADLNLNALFYETFWLGASFRTGDSFILLAEYQISRQFRAGASYDYSYTRIGKFSNGSLEIMLGYDFGKDAVKAKNPRYF
jgi:type IX secretion system PorP/SprF family membrane protein